MSILHTVADLAKKFSMQEATVRKYISEFGIPTEKEGRKTVIPEESAQIIAEILKLKENGMTLKQIKELRDAQPGAESKKEEKPAVKKKAITKKPAKKSADENKEEKPKDVKAKTEDAKPKAESKEEKAEEVTESKKEEKSNTKKKAVKKEEPSSPENLFTRENIGQEITAQARRVSKLNRFLSAQRSPREQAEVKSDLNRRYTFLAGLRYIRDNWLIRGQESSRKETTAKS